MTDAAPASWVEEPTRAVPVIARVEVLVLGGGPAGVSAAIAAARQGRTTLLVERYGFLGGIGTIAQVTTFCGLYADVDGRPLRIIGGIASDLVERLSREGAIASPHSILGRTWGQAYDTAVYKCVLDDLLAEAGVGLLFHSLAVGCKVGGSRIEAVFVENKSGRGAIVADQYIDCSGDADLAHWSGVPTEKGGDDGSLGYPSLLFRMGHVDDRRARELGKPNIRSLMAEAESKGAFRFPRKSAWINPQPHEGEWRANVTQIARDGRAVDGTSADDLSWGEMEGRRQVRDFYRFLREHVPGFEKAYLLDIAPQLGIRETRRVSGEYRLTKEDILGCSDFEDGIGLNSWPLEQHVRGEVIWTFLDGRGYHAIPLGMIVAKGMDNLLVAGRCASATHEAQASVRVSGPCLVMGQAAGTLAALRCGASEPVSVARVQRELEAGGAILSL